VGAVYNRRLIATTPKTAVRVAQQIDSAIPAIPLDLRHTAASLAVSSGAHVKAAQGMLGRASATMALDVYADLFDDELEVVAQAMSAARSAAVSQVGGRVNATTPRRSSPGRRRSPAGDYFPDRLVGFSTTVVRGLRAAVDFFTKRPVIALRARPFPAILITSSPQDVGKTWASPRLHPQ
jgi:hypothetical protein